MLNEEQKQIISEFFDDYGEDLKVGSEEYDELITYLKENTDFEEEEDIVKKYIDFLRDTEGEDIIESLDYWLQYLWEMENNNDFQNKDYMLANQNVAKFKALANKYEEFLN